MKLRHPKPADKQGPRRDSELSLEEVPNFLGDAMGGGGEPSGEGATPRWSREGRLNIPKWGKIDGDLQLFEKNNRKEKK